LSRATRERPEGRPAPSLPDVHHSTGVPPPVGGRASDERVLTTYANPGAGAACSHPRAGRRAAAAVAVLSTPGPFAPSCRADARPPRRRRV